MRFKEFLLTEEKGYFGDRVGGVLSAVNDLNDDAGGMGSRHAARLVTGVVNRIRQILHSDWSVSQRPHLLTLQKVGVALMKSVDEKGDVKETLGSAASELHDLVTTLGTPSNDLGG